jgi:hypothetical protein
LVGDRQSYPAVFDKGSAAAALQTEIQSAGVEVHGLTAHEHAEACGMFYDRAMQGTLRHRGTAELVDALRVATKRLLGAAWGWDRRSTAIDISPLVAVTLAAYGFQTLKPKRSAPRLISLSD